MQHKGDDQASWVATSVEDGADVAGRRCSSGTGCRRCSGHAVRCVVRSEACPRSPEAAARRPRGRNLAGARPGGRRIRTRAADVRVRSPARGARARASRRATSDTRGLGSTSVHAVDRTERRRGRFGVPASAAAPSPVRLTRVACRGVRRRTTFVLNQHKPPSWCRSSVHAAFGCHGERLRRPTSASAHPATRPYDDDRDGGGVGEGQPSCTDIPSRRSRRIADRDRQASRRRVRRLSDRGTSLLGMAGAAPRPAVPRRQTTSVRALGLVAMG